MVYGVRAKVCLRLKTGLGLQMKQAYTGSKAAVHPLSKRQGKAREIGAKM